ncbi:MAG: hypothetical protein NZ561_06040 [Phycisphaerae bacterium]|nr:hypothetical protein [Phycisphaerae bacterium]MDW8260924.1 hypothetical protein [Phycisphaerales bacterium]
MSESTLTAIYRRAQAMIRQDPRKAGILAALLLVLGFMLARHVLSGAPVQVAHATHGSLRVEDPLNDALKGKPPSSATGPVVAWLEQPPRALDRNLFAIRFDLFPPEVAGSASGPEVRGFWDEIAKSLTDQVDQEQKRRESLLHLQQQASRLEVASVMMSATPKAIINDKLVGEGDVVADFRVLKIEARRIIVEREGIRLEIQMK